MFHWLYWEGCWSVDVQLRHNAFARIGESPSHWVNLGVEWRGEGGVQLIGTNISCLVLHESSFVENRDGQYELKVHLGKGDEGSQP